MWLLRTEALASPNGQLSDCRMHTALSRLSMKKNAKYFMNTFYTNYQGNSNVGTKKYIMEVTLTCFLSLFKNVASRKFAITCGTSTIFLLESAGLDPTEKCTSSLQMLQEGSHTL